MLNRLRGIVKIRSRFYKLMTACYAVYKLMRYNPRLWRYAYVYARSFVGGKLPLQDEIPLITLKGADFLAHHLKPDMVVFEYGAGGTTSYVSQRVKRHIFVESNVGYSEYILQLLGGRGYTNIKGHSIPPETYTDAPPPPHPNVAWVTYLSQHQEHACLDFSNYVKMIDQYPDESFDLVLVDGRARQSCVYHALPKVKSGGYLGLDDSHRLEYQAARDFLNAHYPVVHCTGVRPYYKSLQAEIGKTRTSFWHIQH